MRNLNALPIGVIVLVLGATMAMAQPEMRGPGPRDPGMMFERLAQRLDLSDEQSGKLQAVLEGHREAVELQKQQSDTAHKAVQVEIEASEFDETAIRAAAAILAKVEADRFVARAAMLQEVRQILNPEQFEQFLQLQARRHQRQGLGGRRDGRSRGSRGGR